jgi:hypothetical protein
MAEREFVGAVREDGERVILAVDVDAWDLDAGVEVACPLCLAQRGGHYWLVWEDVSQDRESYEEWIDVRCSKCGTSYGDLGVSCLYGEAVIF